MRHYDFVKPVNPGVKGTDTIVGVGQNLGRLLVLVCHDNHCAFAWKARHDGFNPLLTSPFCVLCVSSLPSRKKSVST